MSKTRILIVEDGRVTQLRIQKALKDLGYDVTDIVTTGKEAIQKVSETVPDLVLMDVMLKGDMDGIETAGQIHNCCDVPVVYLTAYADENILKRAMITGPYGYIIKPFKKRELYSNIEMALYKHKMKKELKASENKLREKSKEIEKINEEMKDFLYIVSHDLKEPLFAIGGFTTRLSRVYGNTLDEKGIRYIDRIRANIEIMSKKVSDIMEVLKFGTVEYNFTDSDIGDIIEDVVGELESKIEKKRIKVAVQKNFPIVVCDKKKMKVVFLNLISNASKFMGDEDKRQIKIGCDREREYYKFFVEDTGIGIKEEHQGQIFKIFSRLKDVEAEGTGVGLAIVKKIVELHNGKVWVESPVKNGKGTRFCFTINKG